MTFSIAAIFAAGLLTFASPCVLPLMPIYLATIAGSSFARADRRRTLTVAAAFTLGLGTVFVVLGALAASVGKLLVAQRTTIGIVSALLMVLFGLRSLGVLRIGALDRDLRPGLTRVGAVSGLASAWLFGAAFALGWSPCIGPVLASVLTYAATHSATPLRGAGYLALYAAGLALPMLVLAAAAERATAWLKRFRSALPRLEQLTGVLLIGIGLWTGGQALRAQPASSPSAAPLAAACTGESHTCALPGAVAQGAVAAPQPKGARLLEFTATDCPVCRRMRPVVDKLVAACTELDAHVVRVDVATAHGRALADQLGVRGTPTIVLLDEAGLETERLLGENSGDDLAAAIERAFGLSCSS